MFLFVPYRARIDLHRIPVFTLLIAAACLAVFVMQSRNENRLVHTAVDFCQTATAGRSQFLGRQGAPETLAVHCVKSLLRAHTDARPDRVLAQQRESLLRAGRELDAERLTEVYERYASVAPAYLTARLWYERPSWNVGRMLSSAFSHGSWSHVIFNLFFFVAFAATVEVLLGPVLFVLAFVGIAIGHSVIDTLVHLGNVPAPSLGLSGVVMGMMALFIYFVPRARIKFFYWVIIKFGSIAIPGWLVGLWFIGGDMYDNLVRTASNTNFVAHLGGALAGLLIGVLVFRRKRHWARELVLEE